MANPTTFPGMVRARQKETDGHIWIPANHCYFFTGAFTLTRDGVGLYKMRKTAAANISQVVVEIHEQLLSKIGADPNGIDSSHDIRGYELKSFDTVYAIGTANLNAHSVVLRETTFANNAAPAVATVGGTLTGTLAVATQAQPYVTQVTLATPVVLGRNTIRRAVYLEYTVDAAATSVFDLYGVFLNVNYNLL